MLESGFAPKTFSGVRFALVGFNPVDGNTLRTKLLSGGGVDIGKYNQSCTHLIVDKLVYDDPICVAARSNGKVVVTGSWVDHSFEIGMLIDSNSVLYRPLKDLNGIPGSKSLVVCLTGYQRQDREDIMTMVALMGGQFSKPLVANRVTHLICYKFEGEKYELAKRMQRIKLVNHRWLEDCLKNWKLLPEAGYEISGYELEMMEASARDSEDETEDASAKLGKTSPLGLRVSAAVETPKDIPVAAVQTNSSAQEGSSLSNTSKDNWLTPKKMERSLEAEATLVSTDAVPAASNYAPPPIPLNETTPEQGMGIMENDQSTTSINVSIRRHTSLAAYSRKTLERSSPERNTLRKESSGLKDSITKSGTTLFEVLDKIDDKLHGEEESLTMLPQAKFTDGYVKIHSSSEASIPVAEEESGTARPVTRNNDPTEIGEVGDHKSPASALTTKPLTSNVVVPMEDAISTVERSLTELMVKQEPSSRSAKQNLEVVPSISGHTEAKEAVHELDVSVVPMEADIQTPETKVASDEVPERSTTEPVVTSKSSSALESGLIETKEKLETEFPKKKPVPRKTLGTRGRKKNPINQKGSIYLSEPTSKEITSPVVVNTESVPEIAKRIDSETEALKEIDFADKEISSPVLNTEAEPETAKHTDSADKKSHALEEKDQDNLQSKTSEEADDAEMEITMLEPELEDVPSKDSSDSAALQLEVDKTKPKHGKEGTVEKNSKKGKSSGVKKTTRSRKELDAKANDDTVVKDIGDINSADEKENLVLDDKPEEINQSPIAEAATKDLSEDAAMQSEVEKKKGNNKRRKGTAELQSEKKGNSASTVKKTRKSITEDDGKANDTGNNNSEEVKENVISDGAQSPVMGKPLTKKETAAKDRNDVAMQTKVDMNKRKRGKEVTAEENENIAVGNKSVKSSVLGKPKETSKLAKAKKEQEQELKCFIVSGPRAQRNEYQKILRRLRGKCCRDSHQWSYQATHFIAPEIKRTEKFFAAASSGSWILKTDYVADSKEAGKLLPEEPYEWHSTGISSDGSISLESPRKWRLVKEKTGHGALYGLRIVVYGDCSIPSLDTLKRAVKAGDGTILATAPPYTRFLNQNTDFALISPGMPRVDAWVQEFIRHEIPCVLADYIVEYVCKPGYALDKHVLYNTNSWAERSFKKLQLSLEERVVPEESEEEVEEDEGKVFDSPNVNDVACEVCGSKERGEVMLICGDEEGIKGCGIGTHIDCCVPPLTHVPEHDWFCSKCSNVKLPPNKKRKKKAKY